mgnify:CR=1 FL=1
MLRKLTFVRHAQSIGNTMSQDERAACEVANHAYPLTDMGRQQASMAGKYLNERLNQNWPEFYCQSTFLRTQETLSIVLAELGTPVVVPLIDSRLDEKWDGIFHELSKSDIEKLYPEQVRLRKRSGYYHYRAPGGESCPDTEIRIRSFINESNLDDKHVLVAGHGRWFLILQKILHNLSVEQFLELKKKGVDNCSVTEYDFYSIPVSPQEAIVPWKGHLMEQDTEFA